MRKYKVGRLAMENNYEELYRRVGKLQGWNFSKVKYEEEYHADYNYIKEINKHIINTSLVLDVGTGGGECVLKEFNDAGFIFGIDSCNEMIETANKNLLKYPNKRVKFIKMDANNIKFPNGIFDIVCSRHCWGEPYKAYELLKKGGKYFSEDIENDDCIELKEIFGRGQCFNEKTKLQDKILPILIHSGFKKEDVILYQILINEYYKTEDDLMYLLLNTPIIMNFLNEKDDAKKFNEYVNKYKNDRGILLKRRLFGVIAKKK